MNSFQLKLLNALNINIDELPFYLKDVTNFDIENPDNFLNIDKVKNRIIEAINNNEKIMIYGDYDCDGISATSILYKTFLLLNYQVGYYIPSRYIDGYGLNINRAKQIVDKGYKLLITVDNGVSCKEAIDFLNENNVDVIITDHHEFTDLPSAYSVLHPSLKCTDNSLKQCGAYVALMLSIKLLNRIDDYLVVLACIATISDMMPLKSYNRDIVKLGLKILNNHPEYPLHLLTDGYIDEEVLGFSICPKINAFGRVKEDTSINQIVKFLTSDNRLLISKIANEINQVNEQRKNILTTSISKIDFEKYINEKIIIECFNDISEGLIGLIAARIVNECKKPCIILTKSNGILKGSIRSLKGFSLIDLFPKISDLLLSYGGHEEAGGLSLNEDNYDELVKRIKNMDINVIPEEENILLVDKEDLTYENYCFIRKLSPFGNSFVLPLFQIDIENKNISLIGVSHNHIKGLINNHCSFIGFNMSNQINDKEVLSFQGSLQYDNFKKGENLSFKINKVIN